VDVFALFHADATSSAEVVMPSVHGIARLIHKKRQYESRDIVASACDGSSKKKTDVSWRIGPPHHVHVIILIQPKYGGALPPAREIAIRLPGSTAANEVLPPPL